ncbi:hypothetical protein RCO28_21575 [Streptomyces sp. LHD-70]|uniref:hypothetical protein n=1 Tax=Streptomyces sp. LHD-70 TaxID=3072140 RepID=UPI00280D3F7C|nr:hypothetical protein [Streptomyces sp. LHD-70]MDQ8705063.1 hypothetical protein [Streptomyces sp. LHD-70]
MPWQAPIVVHPFTSGDGRPVSVRGRRLGTAHSDRELLEMLRAAGLDEADAALDDPHLVEWRGAPAHAWLPPHADRSA